MPRRPGRELRDCAIIETSKATEQLKSLLVRCVTAGVLSESIRPNWTSGSAFQLLEWVGDAALHMYLTQQIYVLFTTAGVDEGAMSNVRSACSTNKCLARLFRDMDFARLLHPPAGGGPLPSYLMDQKKCGDVIEAVIGELFEAVKSADSNAVLADQALRAILELCFRLGVDDCPQRFRPAVTEAWLFHVRPMEWLDGADELAQAVDRPNLNIDGRLAPEVYVLGAPPAFCEALASCSGIVTPNGGEQYNRELHIFDDEERLERGSEFWLSHFPDSNGCGPRLVALDFTANYLLEPEAPSRILQRYGAKASSVRFVAVLQEPVARMKRSFDTGQRDGWWPHLEGLTFEDYVLRLLETKGQEDPECGGPFSDIMYVSQLTRFLAVFEPSQVFVLPHRLASRQMASELCRCLGLDAAAQPRCFEAAPPTRVVLPFGARAELELLLEAKASAAAVTQLLDGVPLQQLLGAAPGAELQDWLKASW